MRVTPLDEEVAHVCFNRFTEEAPPLSLAVCNTLWGFVCGVPARATKV
jgi:hypothetical protein